MNNKNDLYFDTHVFCCTNQRSLNHPSGCCGSKGSESLRNYMKNKIKELNNNKIRINASGCLDRCNLGPVMVIYPEGVWYKYNSKNDVDEIIESHLLNNKKVSHLLLDKEHQSASV